MPIEPRDRLTLQFSDIELVFLAEALDDWLEERQQERAESGYLLIGEESDRVIARIAGRVITALSHG